MKENFEKALKLVLKLEGGHINNPADPGGPTNYGITQKKYNEYQKAAYPAYRSLSSVKDISQDEITDIYYNDFWLPAACDKLPDKVDIFHFCNAVNMGVVTAGMILQRAINQITIDAKNPIILKVDGIVGPKTLSLFHLVEVNRVVQYINDFSRRHYQLLVEKNSKLIEFKVGWMNRINKILDFLDNEK